MGTGDLCRLPLAAVRHGRVRQTSGTVPCGDCRMVLWVPGPRARIRGKFVLSRNLGYKTSGGGGRHLANRCSDPRLAYPEVKLQRRDLVRVVGVVAPFAPQDGTGPTCSASCTL